MMKTQSSDALDHMHISLEFLSYLTNIMLILSNYDASYHSFMNFLHWHDILLKSTFLHYLGLIMCFY